MTMMNSIQPNILIGGTDKTDIGNIGDSLKVISSNYGVLSFGLLFSAAADVNATTAGTNNPLILIKNPTESGKNIFIWSCRLGSSVTNTSMGFKFFINPTITTNGTTLTPVNRNVGGSNPATISQAFTLSTISASGTLLDIADVGQNNSSIGTNQDLTIILNPGNNLLITGSPSSNNRNASVTIVWQEV
jgi:hypothetical protein